VTEGYERDLGWDALDGAIVRDDLATASGPYSTLEHAWHASISRGDPLRFYADASVRTTTSYTRYTLRPDGFEEPWRRRQGDEFLWWDVDLRLGRIEE